LQGPADVQLTIFTELGTSAGHPAH